MQYIPWKRPSFPPPYKQIFRKTRWDVDPTWITRTRLHKIINDIFDEPSDIKTLCSSVEASLIYHCLINSDTSRLQHLYANKITAQLPETFFHKLEDVSTYNAKAQMLIQYGVDGSYEEQALYDAIVSNDKDKILLLRDGGTDWQNNRRVNDTTILGACIKTDNISLLHWFVETQGITVEFTDVLAAISHGHHAALNYFHTLSPTTVLTALSDNALLKEVVPAQMIKVLHDHYGVPVSIFSETKLRKGLGTPKQVYSALTEDMDMHYVQFAITRYLKTRKTSPATLLNKAPAWQRPFYLRALAAM